MVEYEEMTVAQLKDVLRERELPVSGKKAELIARLQEADDAAEEEFSDEVDEEFTDEVDEDFDEDDEFFDDEWDDFHVARQKPVLDDTGDSQRLAGGSPRACNPSSE